MVLAGTANAGGPRSIKDDPYGGINWAGFYVGIQGGYGWGDTQQQRPEPPRVTSKGDCSASPGAPTGKQATGSTARRAISPYRASTAVSPGCNPGACFTDIRNLSTSRLRLGYAMDNRLVYVTGGLAYGTVRAGIHNSVDDDKTRFGWALGAGLEWAFAPRWSLKAEYLHIDLGDHHNYERERIMSMSTSRPTFSASA